PASPGGSGIGPATSRLSKSASRRWVSTPFSWRRTTVRPSGSSAGLARLVAVLEGGDEADVCPLARPGHAHGGVAEGVGGDDDPAVGGVGEDDAVLAVGRGLEEAGEALRREVDDVDAGAAGVAFQVDRQ